MRSEQPKTVDVLIVGGGPAGCAAALTLGRYTDLSVMLVERQGYELERVGETLSPGVLPLLDYLGVGDAFRAADFSPSYAFTAAWGDSHIQARDFIFTGMGNGWHLDRRRFDAGLAGSAHAQGTDLRVHTGLEEMHPQESGWRVRLKDEAGSYWVESRFLIDATGRSARIGRAAGGKRVRHDRLVGVSAYFSAVQTPLEGSSLVESVPYGWWYSAPMPDGRVVVVLMTDVDLLREHGLKDPVKWHQALSETVHTRARTASGSMGEVGVWPAHSQWLQPCSGSHWAAAGDAAAAFDPLSSMGIGYALSSGIQAARLAASNLVSDATQQTEEHAAYDSDVQRHIAQFLKLKKGYYSAEARFGDQVFWARRNASSQPA